ncbi:LysR family transcriptional regulator [Clostridium sp.]|uniref:LysR family transcriptional regulator n=1 Tax=Clostridium sp. TaxID=1506 RepID=UPI00359FB9FB
MDTKYLITFKTIIQSGSFKKAALKLNYTPSTVTFHVQQLEQEFSIELFEKIGRKMLLTQAGKDILPYVDNILQSLDYINNYKNEINEVSGHLTIVMPETLLVYKMQPVLKVFREKFTNVVLSIQTKSCYQVREAILDGSADIGIHYDICSHDSVEFSSPFGNYFGVLVASHSMNIKKLNILKENQKIPVGLIRHRSDSIFQEMFDTYIKKHHIQFEYEIELESIEAIKRSVISNLGIAFLPNFSIQEELEKGNLISIPNELTENRVSAIWVYHKNKYVSRPMKEFLRIFSRICYN